jgi:hypothetical protein
MNLKHPLVVALFAAVCGVGGSVAYGWMQTPTDVAVVVTKVENLEKQVVTLNDSVHELNKRIDQLMQMLVNNAGAVKR